jgi:hypothetical protein
LLSLASVAIDGSKFKAVNARDKNFTEAKMKRRLERLDESLRRLFEAAGLGDPQVQRFDLSHLASDLVARSFPANDDRAGLLAMIESTVEGDKMDVGAHWTPEGVRFAFRSAVLSAVKPG